MIDRAREPSPQLYARVGGLLYVVIFVTALFAEVGVRSRLIVSGNAHATAQNILSHQSLWRWGFASDSIAFMCDVAVAWILYVLLRPVDRNVALLAAFFRLVYAAIVSGNLVNHAAVLLLLTANSPTGFEPNQLQGMASVYSVSQLWL